MTFQYWTLHILLRRGVCISALFLLILFVVFVFVRCISLKRTWKNWGRDKRPKWNKSRNRCQQMKSDCLDTSKTSTTTTWKCFFQTRKRLTKQPRTSSKRFVSLLWLLLIVSNPVMWKSRLPAQNRVGCLSAKWWRKGRSSSRLRRFWVMLTCCFTRPFQNAWSPFASTNHGTHTLSRLLTNQSARSIFRCRTWATVYPTKKGKILYMPPRKMHYEKRCMNMTLCAMLNSESFAENNSCYGRTWKKCYLPRWGW